jgi:hypothetical protein
MMNRFQFLLFSFNMRRFTQWINKLRDSKTDCGRGLHSSTFQLNLSRF